MSTQPSTPSVESTCFMDESKSMSQTEFVDFTPIPEAKVLPPAKYKLWLIVFVLVYFASWVSDEAGMREFLEFNGWLSFNASLFLSLGIVVFVLVYATIDVLLTCLTFTSKDGKHYGLGAWLKRHRAKWMYSHENIFFEIMARVVHILEEGFAMFDAPPVIQVSQDHPHQFKCKDGACQKTLKIEHRIKPDKLEDYNKWTERIQKTVNHLEGVECVNKDKIRKERDIEEGSDAPPKDAPFLAVIYVKFDSIDNLNDWMLSPRRAALMNQLEPLLAQEDVVQIEQKRELPDAFTDLLTRQGKFVPKAPPRKWKVWWLTLLALNFSIHWSMQFLPYYFDVWGLSTADERLARLVNLFIVTFLNSYVMTPLFLFLFDPWLQNDYTKNKRQPWVAFDKGFESFWVKLAITLGYYGGCVIAILVKKYAR